MTKSRESAVETFDLNDEKDSAKSLEKITILDTSTSDVEIIHLIEIVDPDGIRVYPDQPNQAKKWPKGQVQRM